MIFLACTLIVCLTVLLYQRKKRECVHEWVVTHEVALKNIYVQEGHPIGMCFILKCKKCGDIKKRQVEY